MLVWISRNLLVIYSTKQTRLRASSILEVKELLLLSFPSDTFPRCMNNPDVEFLFLTYHSAGVQILKLSIHKGANLF